MRRTRTVWILACVLLSGSACAGDKVLVVDGISVYEAHWTKTQDELRSRAGFELDCPEDQLEFHLFRRFGRSPTEVGVEGCGRRETYTRVGYTWFAGSQGGEAAAQQTRIIEEEQRRQQQPRR